MKGAAVLGIKLLSSAPAAHKVFIVSNFRGFYYKRGEVTL
jgi:hypothetical protein